MKSLWGGHKLLGETAAINANDNPRVRHQIVLRLEIFHVLILAVRHHSLNPEPKIIVQVPSSTSLLD